MATPKTKCLTTWHDVVVCNLYKQEHISKKILEHPVQATKHEKLRAQNLIAVANKQYELFSIPALEMAKLQAKDNTLQECRRKALQDTQGHTWVINNECLHHVRYFRQKNTKNIQLVLPKPHREKVMKAYHDELLEEHCKFLKIFHFILRVAI